MEKAKHCHLGDHLRRQPQLPNPWRMGRGRRAKRRLASSHASADICIQRLRCTMERQLWHPEAARWTWSFHSVDSINQDFNYDFPAGRRLCTPIIGQVWVLWPFFLGGRWICFFGLGFQGNSFSLKWQLCIQGQEDWCGMPGYREGSSPKSSWLTGGLEVGSILTPVFSVQVYINLHPHNFV